MGDAAYIAVILWEPAERFVDHGLGLRQLSEGEKFLNDANVATGVVGVTLDQGARAAQCSFMISNAASFR
jgi:hypothetical protein